MPITAKNTEIGNFSTMLWYCSMNNNNEVIMDQIIQNVSNISKLEGLNKTYLPQINIYKNSKAIEKMPLVYNQGVIFMLQGEKCVHTETDKITYNKNNFLVITVPMPLECRPLPKKNETMYAMTMDIEIPTLNQLINKMEDKKTLSRLGKCDKAKGLFVASVNEEIQSALERLLSCLQNPLDAEILGPNIIRELVYNILKKKEAIPLYALAMKNTNISKIELALREVHKSYANQFDVDSLAKSVNMSVSSFHHTFKNVTSSSPIQYLKKVRLSKAREFLIETNVSVNEAARNVGYESVSQFNREFKRYFGMTPGSINKA